MKSGPYRMTRQALPIVFVFALASCSFFDDVVSVFDDDEPATQTAADEGVRARSEDAREAAEDSDTPSLTTVPNRPEAPATSNRQRVVEGLISDRENARYTDEAIRLQGSTRAPGASQSASRPATPAPAGEIVPAPSSAPATVTAATPPPQPPVIPAPTSSAPTAPAPAVTAPASTAAARPSVPPAPVIPPRPVTPSLAASPPAAPVQNGSVTVDMSALGYGGGAYTPVSARVGRETQVATIQFNHSSSRLSARDRQIIAMVASAQRSDNSDVLIIGHASSRTKQLPKARHEVANFKVSFNRANAVAQALIESGVPSDRVTVEAVADDQPIYSEAMPTGEAGNRRTEIFFIR